MFCGKVDGRLYEALSRCGEKKRTGVYWFCRVCDEGIKMVIVELQGLRMKVDRLEEEMKEVSGVSEEWEKCRSEMGGKGVGTVVEEILRENGLDRMTEERNDWKKEIGNKKEEMVSSLKEIMKEEERKSLEKMKKAKEEEERERDRGGGWKREWCMEVTEEIERERRRKILVVMGVLEEGNDGGGKESVENVIKSLMGEEKVDFSFKGRIGKKG